MKDTRNQGTDKLLSVWKNITSNILDKFKDKKNNSKTNQKNDTRDMSDAHTPISHLDLTGMNRQQAKEVIGKLIDERLEMISHLEITELKIDQNEKEKQRAKAAERVNERRSRRKQHTVSPAETIVTQEGVYSDYKHTSVFDVIQPEIFSFEEETQAEPLDGQISITEAMAEAEKQSQNDSITQFDAEFGDSLGLETAVLKAAQDQEEKAVEHFAASGREEKALFAVSEQEEEEAQQIQLTALQELQAEAEEMPAPADDLQKQVQSAAENQTDSGRFAFLEGIRINTSLDEAVDKIFVFYEKNKNKIISFCRQTAAKAYEIWNTRILPALNWAFCEVRNKAAPVLIRIESKLELKKKMKKAFLFLAQKEEKTSETMFHFIERLDSFNEAFLSKLVFLKDKGLHYYNRVREYAETHKKKLLIEFGIGVAAVSVVMMVIGSMTCYEYIYNGKVLGVVKNQEDVYKTIDIIGDKLSYEYDAEITIDKSKDIRFKKVIAFHQDVDDKEAILNRLTYMRDMKANGYGIFVNGNKVATLESEGTAKEVLSEIQSRYMNENQNIEYKKIDFAEKVSVKSVETRLGDIEKKDQALAYMMTGAVEKKIHVVQSGETFSEIAKMYGMKQSELRVSNPEVIPEKLQIGQEICLNQIVPLVTVQTVEVAKYKETIPYTISYESTSTLYKNEQTVKAKGANGEKDVVAEIVRNNGIEVGRKEISSTVLIQPVAQVVMTGTKDPPPLIGTGNFIYPIRGTLTSRYGARWGRLHAGIDLAAPIGTPIKAADGGKVVFAGYQGELGYLVQIDHGGGKVTWYGHCSKLLVKKGDRVYQGQHIANVGNTGRSTGPHVHFEVHINGNTKNPLNYL